MVQNFAVFADRSASAKIKTTKIAASAISIAHLPVRAGATKIKTVNSQRRFREILHPPKFPTIQYIGKVYESNMAS